MTIRTVQILGLGYGPGSCTANAVFNGNVVYTGTIPTVDQSVVDRSPDSQVPLFSFEIPIDLAGNIPMSITFSGNDAFVSRVVANYMPVTNPIYSQSDLEVLGNPASTPAQRLAIWEPLASPPLTSGDIAIIETGTQAERDQVLADHNLSMIISSGADAFSIIAAPQVKNNVVINGVSENLPDPLPSGVTGEWGYEVPVVSGTGTIACDLTVTAGLA